MKIRWYWFRLAVGVPVSFGLSRPYKVLWDRIHGVQVGGWFIGAVRSSNEPVPPKRWHRAQRGAA